MNTSSRVQPEHIRRQQIMNAAYDVIAEEGLANTTIAKIAKQAKVSTGIVSHYFGDKQGLINACMREMLNLLRNKTTQLTNHSGDDAIAKIKAIIDSNFDVSQTNPKAMRLWLEFWSASIHTKELQRLQKINDQRLYSNLKYHFLKLVSVTQADIAARAMAALIDGLWLRGSLVSDDQHKFDREQAKQIAYNYLDMQLLAHAKHKDGESK